MADAETLRMEWATGKVITSADARRAEQKTNTDNLLKMIDEGKI